MPEDLPDRMPEDMPDHMPEDMSDRMSNRMSEDMSDRMPEDFPVRKCINVMVGITRFHIFHLLLIFIPYLSYFTFHISVSVPWDVCRSAIFLLLVPSLPQIPEPGVG